MLHQELVRVFNPETIFKNVPRYRCGINHSPDKRGDSVQQRNRLLTANRVIHRLGRTSLNSEIVFPDDFFTTIRHKDIFATCTAADPSHPFTSHKLLHQLNNTTG